MWISCRFWYGARIFQRNDVSWAEVRDTEPYLCDLRDKSVLHYRLIVPYRRRDTDRPLSWRVLAATNFPRVQFLPAISSRIVYSYTNYHGSRSSVNKVQFYWLVVMLYPPVATRKTPFKPLYLNNKAYGLSQLSVNWTPVLITPR